MAEQDKDDRKPRGSRTGGMPMYASSADYERRLGEVDCVQAPDPGIGEETTGIDGPRRQD